MDDLRTDRYVVGIDLGTSNSALAFKTPEGTAPELLDCPQLAAPGRIETLKTLPSAIYIPLTDELTDADRKMPWSAKGDKSAIVGIWARERGSEVPDRAVLSAKSWLVNGQVNRSDRILPWHSEIEPTAKLSPIGASTAYLQHLRAAFEYARAEADDLVDLGDCEVVLTVPASFDEVARSLTYDAAREAGIVNLTLLEEPQAALYAWIASSGESWRKQVKPGDLVLVCDVGGGTTDFSLIAVVEDQGDLKLERISVGDHLLLGGDNMDLALAYLLRAKLEAEGNELDHWQFLSLVNVARVAKEKLLSDDELETFPISIIGRGSSLFAGTLTTELTRDEVRQVLVEGFFPLTAADEMPAKRRTTGLQEFGLPYETDAAVSRHLARFLRRSRQNIESNAALRSLVEKTLLAGPQDTLMPTAVLFNGGVFKADVLRERVVELLTSWNDDASVIELQGAHLDLAVAQGAAYYGTLRATGKGVRIRAGTARSYYLGLETSMPAVPGIAPPVKGLCIVPQGTEEGTEIVVEKQQFGLVTGEPVEFRFFSSAVRAGDQVGEILSSVGPDLEETSSLTITLPQIGDSDHEIVPVQLDAEVTEVGTLRLYMKHTKSDKKWDLEFNVRPNE